MKIVSFEVAKAIKILGFHGATNHFYSDGYDDEDNPEHEFVLCGASIPTYVQDWNDINKYPEYDKTHIDYWRNVWSAPTYIEVWLWLWREKKKWIDVSFSLDEDGWTFMQNPSPCDCGLYSDPDEAIEAAIKYLVENNLIK